MRIPSVLYSQTEELGHHILSGALVLLLNLKNIESHVHASTNSIVQACTIFTPKLHSCTLYHCKWQNNARTALVLRNAWSDSHVWPRVIACLGCSLWHDTQQLSLYHYNVVTVNPTHYSLMVWHHCYNNASSVKEKNTFNFKIRIKVHFFKSGHIYVAILDRTQVLFWNAINVIELPSLLSGHYCTTVRNMAQMIAAR